MSFVPRESRGYGVPQSRVDEIQPLERGVVVGFEERFGIHRRKKGEDTGHEVEAAGQEDDEVDSD